MTKEVSQWEGKRNTRSITTSSSTRLSLEGTWKVKHSTSDFRIIFEAISGKTVLLETWMAGSSKHSITVCHLDNDRLIATHYCPQENQPRLEFDPEGAADRLNFTYFDATGLENVD
jgi:hypothetical protein